MKVFKNIKIGNWSIPYFKLEKRTADYLDKRFPNKLILILLITTILIIYNLIIFILS